MARTAPLEEYEAKFLFDKMLTTSDAGGHGRVVIPKARGPASAEVPTPTNSKLAMLEFACRLASRCRIAPL